MPSVGEKATGNVDAPRIDTDPAPDWPTYSADLPCPCCGYNLRELTTNRCPECGGHFSWTAELEKATLRETPLFEFQALHRPIKSFVHTSGWILTPWKFWNRVPAILETRVWPLLVQALLTLFLCGSALFGIRILWHWLLGFRRSGWPIWHPQGIANNIELVAYSAVPLVMLATLVWLTLQFFWQTRRSYHVRQRQVLRVLVYPALALLLSGVLTECGLELVHILAFRFRWRIHWSSVEYASTCVGMTWFFLAFGHGLRIQFGIKSCWRMAALVIALAFLMIDFFIIQSGLYFGTFERFGNPVVDLFQAKVPPLWLF